MDIDVLRRDLHETIQARIDSVYSEKKDGANTLDVRFYHQYLSGKFTDRVFRPMIVGELAESKHLYMEISVRNLRYRYEITLLGSEGLVSITMLE